MIRSTVGHGGRQSVPSNTRARQRLLGAVLVPLIGAATTFAAVACAGKSKPGVASAANSTSAAGGWDAYDAKMRDFVTCMHEHGVPGVRYEGHKDTAQNFKDELSGLPDLKGNPSPGLTPEGLCLDKVFDGAPPSGKLRPQPYTLPTANPSVLAELRKIAKCVREHGFSDYPDPPETRADRADQPDATGKGPGDPKVGKAEKDCRKQLGIPEPEGAG